MRVRPPKSHGKFVQHRWNFWKINIFVLLEAIRALELVFTTNFKISNIQCPQNLSASLDNLFVQRRVSRSPLTTRMLLLVDQNGWNRVPKARLLLYVSHCHQCPTSRNPRLNRLRPRWICALPTIFWEYFQEFLVKKATASLYHKSIGFAVEFEAPINWKCNSNTTRKPLKCYANSTWWTLLNNFGVQFTKRASNGPCTRAVPNLPMWVSQKDFKPTTVDFQNRCECFDDKTMNEYVVLMYFCTLASHKIFNKWVKRNHVTGQKFSMYNRAFNNLPLFVQQMQIARLWQNSGKYGAVSNIVFQPHYTPKWQKLPQTGFCS